MTTTSTNGNGPAARRRQRSRSGFRLEAALYGPVKRFLEGQGYVVKGEVRGCDLVARRGDEPPVIVELKLRFNLALVLQGIDRLARSLPGRTAGAVQEVSPLAGWSTRATRGWWASAAVPTSRRPRRPRLHPVFP